MEAIQDQCGFEDGELRVIMVEGQPLFGKTVEYRIHDAKRGRLDEGEISIEELRSRQAWEAPAA